MFERSLIMVSGKGGVGKSALSAALALRAAHEGKRVLALGLVDGLGLAIHLGTEDRGYKPHQVHPGVSTLTVDRARALDEYMKVLLRVPQSAPTRQFAKALNVLVDTAPGVREIISIGKPIFETWMGHYDLVVVDAPPLGQLLSYLRAPTTIADLVTGGVVRQQAEAMRETLADPERSALVLVTTPQELPVLETLEALDDLDDEYLITRSDLVVNRVLEPLGTEISEFAKGPHRQAAAHHNAIYDEQESWRKRLPTHRTLPYLFGLLTPGEVAARLAEHWEPA